MTRDASNAALKRERLSSLLTTVQAIASKDAAAIPPCAIAAGATCARRRYSQFQSDALVKALRGIHSWISSAILAIACASSPAGAIIPKYPACLVSLEFQEGSSALTAAALDKLNSFVMECSAVYGRTVEIEGHSDASEASYDGLALSYARAEAARRYLKSTGVLAQSLQVRAYGDQRPRARPVGEPYVDASIHAMNRRVEIYVQLTDLQ